MHASIYRNKIRILRASIFEPRMKYQKEGWMDSTKNTYKHIKEKKEFIKNVCRSSM